MITEFAEKTVTVQEFLEMDDFEDGFLYELINGKIVKRASPNTEHQRASSRLFFAFQVFNEAKKLGEVFHAPYDVIFDEFNLEQPDIIFVSKDQKNIVKKGCIEGAPFLLVEILSRGTHKEDRGSKFKVYQKHGVREYWIVDPKNQSIEVYLLKGDVYDLTYFASETGSVESEVLKGIKIQAEKIFG